MKPPIGNCVLLDSNIYINEGFNCSSKNLAGLKTLIRNYQVQVVLPDIIEHEVLANARKHAFGSIESANKALKALDKYIPQDFENSPKSKLDILKVSYQEEVLNNVVNVFDSLNPERLECSRYIHLDQILMDYFNNDPPFGSGNKKYEFPDAMIFAAITKWLDKKRYDLVLISEDGDWEKYAKKHGLIHFKTLTHWLADRWEEPDEARPIINRISSAINNGTLPSLTAALEQELIKSYCGTASFNPRYDAYHFVKINYHRANVISYEFPDECKVAIIDLEEDFAFLEIEISLTVNAEIEVSLCLNDPVYGVEGDTNQYHTFNKEVTFDSSISVRVDGDINNDDIDNLEFSDIEVNSYPGQIDFGQINLLNMGLYNNA